METYMQEKKKILGYVQRKAKIKTPIIGRKVQEEKKDCQYRNKVSCLEKGREENTKQKSRIEESINQRESGKENYKN